MSVWHRRPRSDEGFTLIEVLVALIIFAVLLSSTAALLTSSLRGLMVSRADTVGKNLTQEGMEKLRNLPFFVSATIAGGSPDLFDRYYVNTTSGAASANVTGFVSAIGPRSVVDGDPTSGVFFRTVVDQVSTEARYASFSQRIAVQLLDQDGVVITNPSFDATSTGNLGKQPATLVSAVVTTTWVTAGKTRRFSLQTRIADSDLRVPVVTTQARMSAVRISGLLPSNRELLVEAGIINLDGSLSSSTVASASATGARASVANGAAYTGATASYAAPPTGSVAPASAAGTSLSDSSVVAQLSSSGTTNVGASTTNGQPTSGTAAAPVTATMFGDGDGTGSSSLTADNRPSTTSRLALSSTSMIKLFATGCGASCSSVKGTGYLASVGGGSHSATASAAANVTGTLRILPTTFAPLGLLQLTLSSASLSCSSQAGASPVSRVTAAFNSTLSYWRVDPVTGVGGYSTPVTLALSAATSASAADPLSTIPLATTKVGTDGSGVSLFLGDYIKGWSSLTPAAVSAATAVGNGGKSVSISLPGFFTLSSQPLRAEQESTLGIQLGAGTCTAGDLR